MKMTRLRLIAFSSAMALVVCCCSLAGPPEGVSVRSTTQTSPSTADADSGLPILSADGRFVLFASTADNLTVGSRTNTSGRGVPGFQNVYLRDRASGTTVLVSVNRRGSGGGNGDSVPAMVSTNGQYVLFQSSANDLVPADTNNSTDIFLRDLVTGTTTLVSANTNGQAGNGASRSAVMTPDARYAAFVSDASDLVPGDANTIPDVFLRDIQSSTTTLVSVGAVSNTFSLCSSESPIITPDGRFVAFYSTATNIVGGATNTSGIYVRDLLANTTTWASTMAGALFPTNYSPRNYWYWFYLYALSPALSEDGRFLSYVITPDPARTTAYNPPAPGVIYCDLQTGVSQVVNTNAVRAIQPYQDARILDMTPDGRFVAFIGNSQANLTLANALFGDSIYVWDAESGTTILASADLNGNAQTNASCLSPQLDASGRYVLFLSNGANLVTNALQGEFHAYLRDLQTGTTSLLDADSNGVGTGLGPLAMPRLSANATVAAFVCEDSGLLPNDDNHALDVVARDLTTGTLELISAAAADSPSATGNGHSGITLSPISDDGRLVVFASQADDLTGDATNGCVNIFVRDVVSGTNLLVSVGTNGTSADASSYQATISGNGRYIAFSSVADNLAPGDNNHASDVFVYDFWSPSTFLGSVSTTGTNSGNSASAAPLLSSDGRYLLFLSTATTLVPGPFPYRSGQNLFLRDLQGGVTRALTTNQLYSFAATPDGRYVAVGGTLAATGALFGIWDSQAGGFVYTNAASGVSNVAISADGARIVYAANGTLQALDWGANTNWPIAPFTACTHPGLKFSADSRFLVYATPAAVTTDDTNATFDVYLYDFQTASNVLVSRPYSGASGNDASDSPDISPDGRFVAYRSLASNIVPGDNNKRSDIFLYDRLGNTTTLLSVNADGSGSGNGASMLPVFSRNGSTLIFQSWASDLVGSDFNATSDVFAVSISGGSSIPVFSIRLAQDTSVPGGFLLVWPSVSGVTYRVQFKTDPGASQWLDATAPISTVGNQASMRVPIESGARFFRVIASD